MKHRAVNPRGNSARHELIQQRNGVRLVDVFFLERRACFCVVVSDNRQERNVVGHTTYRRLETRINQSHVDNFTACKTFHDQVRNFFRVFVLRTLAYAVIALYDVVAALPEMSCRLPADGYKFNAVNIIGVVIFANLRRTRT